jgi:two-component system osmolarity sensor histidine kinase EnvZ
MITVFPVVIIQIVTTYMFYERHWDSLSRNMVSSLTGEIAMIVNSVSEIQESDLPRLLVVASDYMYLDISIDKNQSLITNIKLEKDFKELRKSLSSRISSNFNIEKISNDKIKISIQIHNDIMNIIFDEKRIKNPSTYIFILWVTGSAIIFMLISVLFLRGQVRSIINLSKAADSFGKGSDMLDFKPQGAKEIRKAGVAFIEMKERIKRLIDTRTQMLAGVSHDLKTPLTRMKLILSLIPNTDKKTELEQEVDEMGKMIEGYLSFAQIDSKNKIAEPIQEINLKNFILGIIELYKNFPNKINVTIPENIYLHIRPEYFKRAISNIIDNATKYSNLLEISALFENECAVIIFDDNGIGIPEDKYEKVFQPFYRIDESRNSDTGGVGLGLSITRDIIIKHGGDIKLAKSPLGGLQFKIILPS